MSSIQRARMEVCVDDGLPYKVIHEIVVEYCRMKGGWVVRVCVTAVP